MALKLAIYTKLVLLTKTIVLVSDELKSVVSSERLHDNVKMSEDICLDNDTQHCQEQDNTKAKNIRRLKQQCTLSSSDSDSDNDKHTERDVSNDSENSKSTVLNQLHNVSHTDAKHMCDDFDLVDIPLSGETSGTVEERKSVSHIGNLNDITTDRTIVTQPRSVQHESTESDSCMRICAHNCIYMLLSMLL